MKKMITATCLFAAAAAFADVATVSNVSIEQDALSRRVSVKYNLSAPAVVTLDIQTNRGDNVYASIGAKHVVTVWKDVNRRVTPAAEGQNEILWQPDKDWNGHKFTDANMVKAVVTAWADDATPDYMAVSLTTTSNVFYYVSEAAVPGGVKDIRYKTDWLLMRKIPAQGVIWRMGIAPVDASSGSNSSRAKAHLVELSSDYYIGVYEFTQRQYANVGGTYPKTPSGDNLGDTKAVCYADYGYVRWGLWDKDNPSHYTISENDFMGKLRKLSGIDFDLPTEAQWEFAARAGEGAPIYGGKAWNNEENVLEIGWCKNTSDASQNYVHEVGQREPNDWGLYDVIGNVCELCLDYYSNDYEIGENGGPVLDPAGPMQYTEDKTRNPRVMRGGSFEDGVEYNSLHQRYKHASQNGWWPLPYGFRVVSPMGGKW
jgi:formylglycine-generating enzyme required for sulfatase activity